MHENNGNDRAITMPNTINNRVVGGDCSDMDTSNMNGLSGGDYSPISHTFFKHPAAVAEITNSF